VTTDNEELVRRVVADWNRGDFTTDVYADDMEFDYSRWAPDLSDPVKGTGNLEKALGPLPEFSEAHFEVRRTIERDDVVVAVLRSTLRGRTSGLDMTEDVGCVFRVRAGQLTRFALYRDPDEALAAAGLAT
jgi:ketosteroid isomerase-like protein